MIGIYDARSYLITPSRWWRWSSKHPLSVCFRLGWVWAWACVLLAKPRAQGAGRVWLVRAKIYHVLNCKVRLIIGPGPNEARPKEPKIVRFLQFAGGIRAISGRLFWVWNRRGHWCWRCMDSPDEETLSPERCSLFITRYGSCWGYSFVGLNQIVGKISRYYSITWQNLQRSVVCQLPIENTKLPEGTWFAHR